ncbi:protein serine/threonine phosphatase [Aureococcus anophagefferens]|nr:protein serine/threonine phosphatase [Aureococcus anophagefferens]
MTSLALPSARGRAPGLALPPRDEAKAPPTPRRGSSGAEVGCGAGWHLRNIRTESAYAAGFRAVDFSPKMIELAGDRRASPVPPGLEKKAVAVDFFPPRDPLMDEAPEDILKRIVREGDLEAWREEEQQLADDAIAVALDNEAPRGRAEVFPGEKVAYEDMCDDEKRIEDAKKMHIKMTRQGPSG